MSGACSAAHPIFFIRRSSWLSLPTDKHLLGCRGARTKRGAMPGPGSEEKLGWPYGVPWWVWGGEKTGVGEKIGRARAKLDGGVGADGDMGAE